MLSDSEFLENFEKNISTFTKDQSITDLYKDYAVDLMNDGLIDDFDPENLAGWILTNTLFIPLTELHKYNPGMIYSRIVAENEVACLVYIGKF